MEISCVNREKWTVGNIITRTETEPETDLEVYL